MPPRPLVAKMIGLGRGADAALGAGVGVEFAEVVLAIFNWLFAARNNATPSKWNYYYLECVFHDMKNNEKLLITLER